jgi:hypothetical protein
LYVRQNFVIFGKNLIFPENLLVRPEKLLVCPEIFLGCPPPPVANISGKIFLGAFSIETVPLEACPPQLLDAFLRPCVRPNKS